MYSSRALQPRVLGSRGSRCRQSTLSYQSLSLRPRALPSDAYDDDEDEDWYDELPIQDAAEVVSTSDSQNSTPNSRTRRNVSVGVQPQAPVAQNSSNDMFIAAGVGALLLLAAGGLWYKRKGKVNEGEQESRPAPGIVAPGPDKKKLAEASRNALNSFIDQIRLNQVVDLSGKNLMDEGAAYIAEGLAFNSTCKVIKLGSNGIGTVACTQLAESLKANGTLEELRLDTNQIDDAAAEALANMLAGNASIARLMLSANRISDAGMAALAEMLRTNKTLLELDLSSNEVSYEGAVALAKALTENSTLKSLSISDNYIGTLGSSTIANAMAQNNSITKLYMKGCELGDDGIERLCSALVSRDCNIELLDIGNNGMSAAGAEHVGKLLAAKDVKEIHIYMNDFGDAGMGPVSQALKERDTLEVLELGGNNIGAEGAKQLANALRGKKNLHKLDLGYNPLGEKGARAVVDVVKYELPLKEIKMGWCKVGDKAGAQALGELLQFNETLEDVDFRGNNLGDNGAMIIGRSLRQMQSSALRKMDLGYNEIMDDGAFTIANALKNNPEHLPLELQLAQNYIGREGRQALQEAMEDVYELYGHEMMIVY